MEYTPNLNLAKPGTDDDVDISVLNSNSDIIDTAIANCKANYSTTEHEVGTWIDGSTLYEKTYQAEITEAGEIDIDATNENIADCVYFECVGKENDDNGYVFGVAGTSNNDIEGIGGYYIDDFLYVDCNISNVNKYPITVYVTIRYTKVSE
jgi:hypothetical protein